MAPSGASDDGSIRTAHVLHQGPLALAVSIRSETVICHRATHRSGRSLYGLGKRGMVHKSRAGGENHLLSLLSSPLLSSPLLSYLLSSPLLPGNLCSSAHHCPNIPRVERASAHRLNPRRAVLFRHTRPAEGGGADSAPWQLPIRWS